jgi:CheY-like chemotaxis protein
VECAVAGNSPLSLLYVEDEPIIRDVVCTFVRNTFPDIQLYTAENGNEGLERFKDLRPDIVVTDIKMPVMNGIEMARTIKAINCSTQIIVTSAYGDNPCKTYKCLPQHVPSYMAIMLNVTDATDGFFFPQHHLFSFSLG